MDRRDKQLNGTLYSIILPPPTVVMPICNRAAVLLGAFAGLLADASTIISAETTKDEKIGLVLGKLSEALKNVDPIAAHHLMMDAAFAARLSIGAESLGTEMAFNKHFSDHRGDVYQILTWCLWECIQDFFPQLGHFSQTLRSMAEV